MIQYIVKFNPSSIRLGY